MPRASWAQSRILHPRRVDRLPRGRRRQAHSPCCRADPNAHSPPKDITLHGKLITVEKAHVRALGGSADARWTTVPESQTIAFALDHAVAGRALLELEWSGVFSKDMRGLYLAGGIAVTQFEAADARRV